MRKFSIVALVLVLALCATAVWGQMREPRQPRDGMGQAAGMGQMGMGMGCPAGILVLPRAQLIERGGEELQLTEEQRTRLRAILAQHDQTIRPLMQRANESTLALRNGLVAPQYDAQNIQSLAAAAHRAEADVINARINGWTQIREVLTAEQVTKLREMMTQPRQAAGGAGQRPAGQRQGGQRPGGPAGPPP